VNIPVKASTSHPVHDGRAGRPTAESSPPGVRGVSPKQGQCFTVKGGMPATIPLVRGHIPVSSVVRRTARWKAAAEQSAVAITPAETAGLSLDGDL
jgi:hypothetical protein